jgi:hypothetical protein
MKTCGARSSSRWVWTKKARDNVVPPSQLLPSNMFAPSHHYCPPELLLVPITHASTCYCSTFAALLYTWSRFSFSSKIITNLCCSSYHYHHSGVPADCVRTQDDSPAVVNVHCGACLCFHLQCFPSHFASCLVCVSSRCLSCLAFCLMLFQETCCVSSSCLT